MKKLTINIKGPVAWATGPDNIFQKEKCRDYVIRNFTTSRFEQAKVYDGLVDILVEEYNQQEDPSRLFTFISENKIITDFLTFMNILTVVVNNNIGPIYKVARCVELKNKIEMEIEYEQDTGAL